MKKKMIKMIKINVAGCFEDFGSTSSRRIFSLWFIHVKAIVAAIRGTFSHHDHDNENNYF